MVDSRRAGVYIYVAVRLLRRVIFTTEPNLDVIYKRILQKSGQPLPGYDEIIQNQTLTRALKIYHYLQDRADRLNEYCYSCSDRLARRSLTRYVYETPWDDQEVEKLFCSDDCEYNYLYGGDFSYFICGKCEREICGQNPRNGWHIQYRDYDDETVCLKCYEDLILTNGVEREKLENGKIPGMFFSYGNLEPKQAGYREVLGFTNFFISNSEQTERFRKKALELMDKGRKVVIGYERMAIGGGEGYVTMFEKAEEKSKRGDRNALQNQGLDSG